jgi:two-component system cell cycle sensor histidine kinase/response regulator CckA
MPAADASHHQNDDARAERDMTQAMVQASPAFFVAIDSQGRTRLMNQCMLDALGYTHDEVAGQMYMPMFVPPEDHGLLAEIFQKLCTQESATLNENRVLTKAGRKLLVEWHGRPMFGQDGSFEYFFGVGIDVTERNAAQEALRRSEELSRKVIEGVPGGVVLVGKDGAILKANSEAQRFLGLSYDDLKSMYVSDFNTKTFYEDGSPCAVPDYPVSKALQTGLPQPPLTLGVQRPDGITNWGVFTATPVPDPVSGEGHGAVVTFLDISQRRKEERERLALERKLLEAQKLESLGILAGGIAHDFNNLLAGILGNANLATMMLPKDSPVRPFLEGIESTSHVAARLCAQMLAYAGRGRTLVQPTNVNSVIDEMNRLLSIFVGERVELQLQLAPALPPVTGDTTQLRQILLNLVINASEAIGENPGYIRIVTGVVTGNAEYVGQAQPAELKPGEFIFIDVIDSGCGMDEATRSRVFDPFFTTKFTGRGLGLAATLGIVRGHDGGIKVDSTPGKGTTFRVLLPVIAGK